MLVEEKVFQEPKPAPLKPEELEDLLERQRREFEEMRRTRFIKSECELTKDAIAKWPRTLQNIIDILK